MIPYIFPKYMGNVGGTGMGWNKDENHAQNHLTLTGKCVMSSH